MINWTDTNLEWSDGKPILNASVPLLTEGMALVAAFEQGVPKVTPSTGATTDSFIGVAQGPRRTFSSNFHIENIMVPAAAPYTVLLGHAISAGNGVTGLGLYSAAGGLMATSTGDASPSNTMVGTDPVTGLTLVTFDPSFAGQAMTAAYRYVMGTQEETSTYGSPTPGTPAESQLALVEVMILGRMSTNMVDPMANWYAGGGLPLVKIIAGGIFTDANNAAPGIIPSNVRVNKLPTAQNAFLSLDLR